MASKSDETIIAECKRRFKRAEEWESRARLRFRADIRFAEGDSDNGWQWDDETAETRGDRPTLTFNKARQHCLQIINDARQNKAAIKVAPVGGGATYEAAQMLAGLIRHVEYQSQATEAYEAAVNSQVRGGWGYWRVETDYAGDDTLDLELFIRRIADPLTVYLDPEISQFDGSDAKWGVIFRERKHDDVRGEQPKLDGMFASKPYGDTGGWLTEDGVREAEYYRVVDDSETLHLLDDGTTAKLKRGEELPDGRRSMRSRSIPRPRIEWFKIVGSEIVDREDWPGRYIPIVRVIGEETVIDGELDRKGHTRAMKDANRMYNYWASAAVEHVALQSKAPYVAASEAIEGHETYWDDANTESRAWLPYNHRDEQGQELPMPRRQEPPTMAQAYIQGLQIADQQLLQVSGQYQAELGRPGNETSGVAIQQRQRQGDNATYHFIDHLAQAIRYTGRILIDLFPHVYDTARVLKIVQEDDSDEDVHIDPDLPEAHAVQPDPTPMQPDPTGQQPSDADQAQARVRRVLNPAVGRYFVQADVGPSFGTQRQEAFDAFTQITAQNHDLWPICGDLLFKNADMPGADEIAERLKRMVPAQALGGPGPELQKMQQQLQATMQHAQQMAQHADATVADLNRQIVELKGQAKDKSGVVDNATYDAETRRLAVLAQADPAAAQMIFRSMLTNLLGLPATPVVQAHELEEASHQHAIEVNRAVAASREMPAPPGEEIAQAATSQPQAVT